jgi:hypothetical protein
LDQKLFNENGNGNIIHSTNQTLAKTAGVITTAAFATAGFPPAALAAKKAKQVVEVVETVDNTKKFVAAGAALIAGGAAFTKLSGDGGLTENFLEASPYWDQSTVPVNVYKNKAPFTGKVVSTKRIVGPQATGETCHIIIDHRGKFPVSTFLLYGFAHDEYLLSYISHILALHHLAGIAKLSGQ